MDSQEARDPQFLVTSGKRENVAGLYGGKLCGLMKPEPQD